MDGPRGARSEDHRLKLLDAAADAAHPDASVGMGLIVRDLARALGAEMAVLMVADEDLERVEVLATWGAVTSPDGLAAFFRAGGGFVGRALGSERATVEPIDPHDGSLGKPTSGARITHVLGAPVKPLNGPPGVLCAAFSSDPSQELPATLWLGESYARLASLCLHDGEALNGLLSGGRLDGLTGCLTQAAILQELQRELARSDRHDRPLSCSFIDLDHFKRVNDRYGHLHGSRVLASIAEVLRSELRDEDTLGRYGGDEFVVSLPDTDEAAAVKLSERLRSTIAKTMINLPHDPIDASIGVAQWRRGSTLQALLGAADEALLAAKASGGGTAIAASALTTRDASEDDSHHPPARAARPTGETSHVASVKEILDVSAQFDESGGASIELTALELNIELAHVVSAWSHAIKGGFLEPAGTDRASGEEMWRLSDQGRRAHNTLPGIT